MLVSKSKIYACLNQDGGPEMKGVSSVRSNTPPIQSEDTAGILRMCTRVVDRTDFRNLVCCMLSEITTVSWRFLSGRVRLDEVATPVRTGGKRWVQYIGQRGVPVEVNPLSFT